MWIMNQEDLDQKLKSLMNSKMKEMGMTEQFLAEKLGLPQEMVLFLLERPTKSPSLILEKAIVELGAEYEAMAILSEFFTS